MLLYRGTLAVKMRKITTRLFVVVALFSFVLNVASVGLNVLLVKRFSEVTIAKFNGDSSTIYEKAGFLRLYEFEFSRGIDTPLSPAYRSGRYGCAPFDGRKLGNLDLGMIQSYRGTGGGDFWEVR
ncbi:MAG: hypothetical protein HYT64_02940 [Candidatus Yanofskybacteria bacterium]|nr:hypothetical protein [Candidatus Yanofskybacteria bacterium]